MVNKVKEEMIKYHMIEPGDVVIAGVSGGADSVCLLLVLEEIQKEKIIPFSIEVVHVNHGIRREASEDADFVRALCETKDIPFHLISVDIKAMAKEHQMSEEEMGRKVRYEEFQRILGTRKGKIAVAHNSNDRAETMLFHLFRGTGLTGICGIRPVQGKVIRPLLNVERKEIEEWLAERNTSFCTDKTNFEDDYTRNRIRHHILSYAEDNIVRGAVSNMNRAAIQLEQAEDYIAEVACRAVCRCCEEMEQPHRMVIHLDKLQKEDAYIQRRVLLYSIYAVAGSKKDITEAHVQGVLRLFQSDGSKKLSLPYGVFVYKQYETGILQKGQQQETSDLELPEILVGIPSIVEVPVLGTVKFEVFPYVKSEIIPQKTYTKWFDYDKITKSLFLRTRKTGDYLTVTQNMGRKSLQDYFVDQKIPKEKRDFVYVLAEENHILWIPGMRISTYYKVEEQTRNILQVSVYTKEK